ncbi:MAG: GerMN domain-containing protein [Treponema sp.]|nr:GerMN domain-containing protein [Treponema sp.]
MAASGKKKKSSGFGWLLFWLAFLIGVTLLFVVNREKIQNSLSILKDLVADPEARPGVPGSDVSAADTDETDAASGVAVDRPAVEPPAAAVEPAPPPLPDTPSAPPAVQPQAAPPAVQPGTVKRQVYLIRLDNDGGLVAAKVERSLPSGDSPMRDALEAVIRGPSADEAKRNLLSLIPENVTILGATVRGSTAYIDFSEDFLFNTYGIEGYAGQLRQVVWTATEFGNVKDVQILIEGKRLDYLGEGIWIGSPLSRDSL